MVNNLNELYDAVLIGKLEDAVKVIKIAAEEGMIPHEIVNQYMIKAMEEIGNCFETGRVFVPDLLTSTRAVCGALDVLKPLMQGQVGSYIDKIVINAMKEDLYDIGKDLVTSMFEGCGFGIINLRADVSSDRLISAALENKADITRMSALLATAMNYMKEAVIAVKVSELRGEVGIMVEGVPVDDAFAEAIGTGTYASNVNATVVMAKKPIAANQFLKRIL